MVARRQRRQSEGGALVFIKKQSKWEWKKNLLVIRMYLRAHNCLMWVFLLAKHIKTRAQSLLATNNKFSLCTTTKRVAECCPGGCISLKQSHWASTVIAPLKEVLPHGDTIPHLRFLQSWQLYLSSDWAVALRSSWPFRWSLCGPIRLVGLHSVRHESVRRRKLHLFQKMSTRCGRSLLALYCHIIFEESWQGLTLVSWLTGRTLICICKQSLMWFNKIKYSLEVQCCRFRNKHTRSRKNTEEKKNVKLRLDSSREGMLYRSLQKL